MYLVFWCIYHYIFFVLSHISLGLKTNKTLKLNLKNSSFIVRLKQQTPLITHQLEQMENNLLHLVINQICDWYNEEKNKKT
jgi:hypothetical protein